MSMMYANGIITKELCPNCDNPEPVEVRHGHSENGYPMHDYDCGECGGFMSIVDYPCPECAVSQLTQRALDDANVERHGQTSSDDRVYSDNATGAIPQPAGNANRWADKPKKETWKI